jgi:hypothetical protein
VPWEIRHDKTSHHLPCKQGIPRIRACILYRLDNPKGVTRGRRMKENEQQRRSEGECEKKKGIGEGEHRGGNDGE